VTEGRALSMALVMEATADEEVGAGIAERVVGVAKAGTLLLLVASAATEELEPLAVLDLLEEGLETVTLAPLPVGLIVSVPTGEPAS